MIFKDNAEFSTQESIPVNSHRSRARPVNSAQMNPLLHVTTIV
jgi:hypothetical protein